MRMKSIIGSILAGCAGLILATLFVSDFIVVGDFSQSIKVLLLAGIVLGLINAIVKPLINLITLPLRWLTFGLFSLVINIGIIWGIDIIFSPELSITGLKALFLTALLVWLANFFVPRKKKSNDDDE